MSLASGSSSGTRSTRGSVITDRKSLSRRYSAVLRVYTWPTRVCCCWGGRAFAIARTRRVLSHMHYGSRYVTLRGRATHEYSKERIHSALGLGSPWRLVLCVNHTTRITMSSSLAGRFRPKSEMERLRRSLTLTACDLPTGLRSAAPRLSTSPCAASSLFETYCRLQSGIACAH